jgi:hypothetical protein
MRRGCLSLGEVKCESCGCTVPYPERYLVVDEDDKGNEVEKGGKSVRYCVKDALKKGYARWEVVKGEKVLTFLPQSEVVELPATKEVPAPKKP